MTTRSLSLFKRLRRMTSFGDADLGWQPRETTQDCPMIGGTRFWIHLLASSTDVWPFQPPSINPTDICNSFIHRRFSAKFSKEFAMVRRQFSSHLSAALHPVRRLKHIHTHSHRPYSERRTSRMTVHRANHIHTGKEVEHDTYMIKQYRRKTVESNTCICYHIHHVTHFFRGNFSGIGANNTYSQ